MTYSPEMKDATYIGGNEYEELAKAENNEIPGNTGLDFNHEF
jgi:hypothetical protein